jgi:hypothetical protein
VPDLAVHLGLRNQAGEFIIEGIDDFPIAGDHWNRRS